MSSLTVHYAAKWAAEGGPCPSGPNLVTLYGVPVGDQLCDDTSGGIAVAWVSPGKWCVVACHTGDVYAEADTPDELAGWMAEYLAAMGREIRSWSA